MDDRHIVNCVHLLKRQAQREKFQDDMFYVTTPGPQGEHAGYAFDRECIEVWEREWHDNVPKIFWNMLMDIKRRAVKRPGIIKNLIGIPDWILGKV